MRRQLKIFASLACADLGGFLLSLSAGLALRQFLLPHLSPFFQANAAWQIEYLWLLIIGVGVFAYDGLYTRRHTAWEELRHLIRSFSVAMILFLAFMTVLKRGAEVSRPALVLAWVLAPGVLIGIRVWLKRGFLAQSRFWPRRVLVVGTSEEASQLALQLEKFSELGFVLVGYLGKPKEFPEKTFPLCGTIDELEPVVVDERIDEVIIASPGESRLKQFELLKRAESLVPKVSVLPELFDADKLNVEIEKIERYFLLCFRNNLLKRGNRLLKSTFEILMLLLASPLWVPLMLALVVAVKLSSAGPVFFGQERIGRQGRPFKCLKFRTMVPDAEERLKRYLRDNAEARCQWEGERKLKNDPRITRIGHFLRRTSLDELPQLLNVLRGEMSLIGPRPIVQDEIEKYGEYFRYYAEVSPGLSGLWQVSGRNDVDYQQRVMLDTFYVRNWSLWLDFMILLRTVPTVLKRQGAY